MAKSGWKTKGLHHHSEGPQQAEEMSKEEISWSWIKGNANSCAWRGINPHPSKHWRLTFCKISFAKNNLVVLVDNNLTMNQKCTMTANKCKSILNNNRKSIASRFRMVIVLFCSALVSMSCSGLYSTRE